MVVVHTLDRWSRNLRTTLESLAVLGKHGCGPGIHHREHRLLHTSGEALHSDARGIRPVLLRCPRHPCLQRSGPAGNGGKTTGANPFGYESCWTGEKGQRQQQCDPEHPGGVHIHPEEGPAVEELFRQYATGATTLAERAGWLNGRGFRTRNLQRTLNADGELVSGPRLFTTASVRVVLHNAFYTGLVKHRDRLFPRDPRTSNI